MEDSYEVECNPNGLVTIRVRFYKWALHRVPYNTIKSTINQIELENDNIVYLLTGKNSDSVDSLYVGMSSDGLRTRPTGHSDKNIPWDYCFFLSSDTGIINGAKAEYIEYRIANLIKDSSLYDSQTERVSDKKADPDEKRFCDRKVLPDLIQMLDILGIHLKEQIRTDRNNSIESEKEPIPMNKTNETDYSKMKMGTIIDGWLGSMEQMVKTIDSSVETIVKFDSKYVAFKKGKKTVIRCYPKKDEPRIDVFFYGNPEIYKNTRVSLRPEDRHDKPLDTMFVIRNNDDLRYFNKFASIAIALI